MFKQFRTKLKKKRKQALPFLLGAIAILIPIAYLTLAKPNTAEAAWFNDTWKYRSRVPVTNNTTEESNVYINFTGVDAIDTSDTTKWQGDCGDLRFTTQNGDILRHYVSSGCGTSTTVVQVELPTLPAGDIVVYYYYGNPSIENGGESAAFSTEASNYTIGTQGGEETAPSPIGYWALNEGRDNSCSGGEDACDSTSNENHGTFSGSPTWQSEDMCISGKCLLFNGTSDYIDTVDIDYASGGYTVSAWFRTTGSGDMTIISKRDSTNDNGRLLVAGNAVEAWLNDGTAGDDAVADSSQDWSDGQWHHAALVVDSGNMYLYLEGELRSSDTHDGSILTNNVNWMIGAREATPTAYFDGFLDEVKLYSYARSAEEIKADYNSRGTVAGVSTQFGPTNENFLSNGLVAYWALEDNVSGTGQTITDTSGSGNNGTTSDGNATLDCTVAGKFGYGCDFEGNGGDDDVNFGDVDIYSTDFTLSAWINVDDCSADECTIISKYNGINYDFAFRVGTDNALEFFHFYGNDWKISAASVISNSTWHHVAAVFYDEPNDLDLYLDGEYLPPSQQDDTFQVGFSNNSTNMTIGRRDDGGDEMDGTVDEVRVYHRALSAGEIRDLYNWAPGPVGYWPLDENTGTSTVTDASANGNTGVMSNFSEADWVPGKFGAALNFTAASNTEISIANNTKLSYINDVSASAWFKVPNVTGDKVILCQEAYNTSNDCAYRIMLDNDEINVKLREGGSDSNINTTNANLIANRWYHVAFTFSDFTNTVNIYLDGKLATSSNSVTQSPNDSDNTFEIGFDTATRSFEGTIDEVRVYNYVRTYAQIIQDMNGGHPLGGSPIGSKVMHLTFDDATQDTVYDVGTGGNDGDLLGTCPGAATCPSYTANGKINGGLLFNTNEDSVSMGDVSFLDGVSEMTTTLWLNPSALTVSNDIIGKWATNQANFFVRTTNSSSDEIFVFIANATTDAGNNYFTTSNLDLSTSTWQHLAIVYDGSLSASERVKVYKNGKPVSGSVTGTLPTSMTTGSTSEFRVGDQLINSVQGTVDEVKVYTSALSIDELLIDLNAGSSASFSTLGVTEASTLVDGAGNPPIGYWPMNENTGTSTTADISGNGYTGTLSGTMTEDNWTTGKYSSALLFDGVDDHIDPGTLSASSVYTISAWLKLESRGARNIVTGFSGTGVNVLIYYDNASQDCLGYNSWNFDCYGATGLGDALSDGNWHHVAYIFNDNAYASNRLWFDGIEQSVSQVVGTSSNQTLDTEFDIGARGDSNSNWEWQGGIDEFKVWDYALTPAQVAYEYNRGKPVAHWTFDECEGTTIYDVTDNSYDGTLNIAAGNEFDSAGTCGSGTSTEAWNGGTTGKFNGSIALDGGDEYVEIADADVFSFGDSSNDRPFSMTGWVYYDQAENSLVTLISKYDATATELEYRLQINSSDQLFVELGDDSTFGNIGRSSTRTLANNTWQHFAVTYDGSGASSGIDIYLNGEIVDDADNDAGGYTAMENTTAPVWIGAQSIGGTVAREIDAQIDDVRIYNYELTQEQVKTVMNNASIARFGPSTGSP